MDYEAITAIARRKSGDVDNILGCAKRRGIGRFQRAEVFDRHAGHDRGHQHIQSLVNPGKAALCNIKYNI